MSTPSRMSMSLRRLSKAAEMLGNVKALAEPCGSHSERIVPFGRVISSRRLAAGTPCA
jgi:hypothetical protein